MAHYVECVYCHSRFNRDKEPTIQVSARRYAHKECAEEYEKNKTQEEKDLEALEKYIMKLLDEPYINIKTKKQLKEYREKYNYTYSGMLKTLVYWYEIKNGNVEQANGGIGIIPYIYDKACDYYYSLYLIKLSNEGKNIEKYKPKEKIVEIFSPKYSSTKKIKLFNLDDNEEVNIET